MKTEKKRSVTNFYLLPEVRERRRRTDLTLPVRRRSAMGRYRWYQRRIDPRVGSGSRSVFPWLGRKSHRLVG
jgi:hypothetical protein